MRSERKTRRFGLQFAALVLAVIFLGASGAWAAEPPILKGASAAEKARVMKLIAGAKKEGKLVYISNSMGPDVALPLFEDFKVQYGLPNLKLEHTMKRSGGVISTIKTDIRARRYTFDVINVGSPSFFLGLFKRGNLMKYDSPYYENFMPEVTGKKMGAVAKPGYFISSYLSIRGTVWNPKYVKKNLKTWEDVLDPKYKGKIVIPDILKSATIVNVYIGLRKVIPRSYFEKLAKLNPVFVLSTRAQIRMVMTGEKWIAIMTGPTFAYKEVLKGAKLEASFPPGGTVALGYPFAILAKAPHPNAAKLWIDYLHTRHGHDKHLAMKGFNTGIKNPVLSPLLAKFAPALETLNKNSKVIPMDWEKIGEKEVAAARAEWREIFYESKK